MKRKIGDLVDIRRGASPRPIQDYLVPKGMPWIKIADATEDKTRFITKTKQFIKPEGVPKSVIVEPGTMILSNSATPGLPKIVQITACIHDGWLMFSNYRGITRDYLYYVFLYIRDKLVNNANGSVFNNLKTDIVRDYEINIPPITTQNKIVMILSTLDKAIENNMAINDNLEEQARLLFDEWFVKEGGSKTSDAEDEVLGNVVSIVKKTFNPEKEPEIQLEHYSIPAFDAGKFPVFESSLSIKSNKYIVDKNCFMISKLNPTTKRVWRPYCLTNHAVCSTEFIVFKAKENTYTDFLYSLINCDAFSEHLCNHVTGSTGSRQRTNPDDALKFVFKLPTEAVISEFSSIVAPMYEQIRTNTISNNSLKQLRDYLLPLLMSGQVSIGG